MAGAAAPAPAPVALCSRRSPPHAPQQAEQAQQSNRRSCPHGLVPLAAAGCLQPPASHSQKQRPAAAGGLLSAAAAAAAAPAAAAAATLEAAGVHPAPQEAPAALHLLVVRPQPLLPRWHPAAQRLVQRLNLPWKRRQQLRSARRLRQLWSLHPSRRPKPRLHPPSPRRQASRALKVRDLQLRRPHPSRARYSRPALGSPRHPLRTAAAAASGWWERRGRWQQAQLGQGRRRRQQQQQQLMPRSRHRHRE